MRNGAVALLRTMTTKWRQDSPIVEALDKECSALVGEVNSGLEQYFSSAATK